jgi:hypothetical protein
MPKQQININPPNATNIGQLGCEELWVWLFTVIPMQDQVQ